MLERIGKQLHDNTDIPAELESIISGGSDKGPDEANRRLAEFWLQAHTLSCLRHRSFQSSTEETYKDTLPTSVDTDSSKTARQLEQVKKVIGESATCALINSDGEIVNVNRDAKTPPLSTLFCMRRGQDGKVSSSQLPSGLNTKQLQTIASVSGVQLARPTHRGRLAATSSETMKVKANNNDEGWIQYLTSPVRKISGGVTYVVDSILNGLDGEGNLSSHVSRDQYSDADVDDALSALHSEYEDEDDAKLIGRGKRKHVLNGHRPLDNTDGVISVSVIVQACRHLLDFASSSTIQHPECSFVFLRDSRGEIDRLVLHRRGWESASFGSFCRKAGSNYATIGEENSDDIQHAIGKLLADISDEGLDLFAETMRESGHAIMENETITIFPGGVPLNYEPCKSDHALFQIHVTNKTIQTRMKMLEQNAEQAKCSAVGAQRNGMTKLALVHMRRRKAAVEELERCAMILSNLDSSELRLERAKSDVQIVQSYSLLKTALQDIRTTSGIGSDDVDDLMCEIREEMEKTNLDALGQEGVYPEIDEDELNAEFNQLQLECDLEQDGATGIGHVAELIKVEPAPVQKKEEQSSEEPHREREEPVPSLG